MHTARIAVVIAGGLGLGVLLGACTSGQHSQPTPTTTVPTIAGDPLDMSQVSTRPCALLRPDQLAQYHLTVPGTMITITGVPGCAWTPQAADLPSYQAGVDLHSGGLAALYRRRASMPIFQPTSVSEYPAVHTAIGRGRCTVQVGVANDTLVIVNVAVPNTQSPDYTDPCDDADTFAADIIADGEGTAP